MMGLRSYSVMVDPGAEPERGIAFVPDRFAWLACFFTVFWALAYGLWWRALALVVVIGSLVAGGHALGVEDWIVDAILVVIAFYVGFEAQNWRRRALERRGWYEAAVIAAPNRAEAERRYFAEHAHRYAA
jgi:hypothetical protein